MHKLISSKFIHYDDFYQHCDEYRASGVDECTIPNPQWMSEIGKEYYFIWCPQTNRRTKMEVAFGKISRGQYGYPQVDARYLDKPYRSAGWNNYFPAYCWSDAFEFMGIPITNDNKLSCLVFDNEAEAREYCNKYNEWKENKNKKAVEDYLKSDFSVKRHTYRFNKVKDFVNSLDIENIDTYCVIDALFESVAGNLGWYKEENSNT